MKGKRMSCTPTLPHLLRWVRVGVFPSPPLLSCPLAQGLSLHTSGQCRRSSPAPVSCSHHHSMRDSLESHLAALGSRCSQVSHTPPCSICPLLSSLATPEAAAGGGDALAGGGGGSCVRRCTTNPGMEPKVRGGPKGLPRM